MENRIRLHYIWLIFCVMALSCTRNEEMTDGIGYLTLGDIQVDKAMVEAVDSRVGADNDFYIEIYKGGVLVEGGKFLPSDVFPKRMPLKRGDYTYKLYNEAYNQYLQWTNDNLGEPVYYHEGEFTIASGTTINLDATVEMCVCAVKLVPTPGYDLVIKAHSMALEVGGRKLSIAGGQTAYFPLAEQAQLKYQFSMTNVDGESFELPQEVYSERLEANTIYEINVDLSGTVSLSGY